MARKTGKAKKWAVSAALVGGVAAGVVTAAGASTTSRPTTDPIGAEASQLHQQVLSLSNQEQYLKSELPLPKRPDPTNHHLASGVIRRQREAAAGAGRGHVDGRRHFVHRIRRDGHGQRIFSATDNGSQFG